MRGGGLSISRHGSAFSRFPDMYSRTHVGMCLQYWLKRELWHRSVFILNFCEIDRVFYDMPQVGREFAF